MGRPTFFETAANSRGDGGRSQWHCGARGNPCSFGAQGCIDTEQTSKYDVCIRVSQRRKHRNMSRNHIAIPCLLSETQAVYESKMSSHYPPSAPLLTHVSQ